MNYNPEIHHRRSIRLRGYDYSQAGAYFVTICVQGRECLFGNIQNDIVELNEYGKIVYHFWEQVPKHFQNADIDFAVVMPNHFHGIIVIGDDFKKGINPGGVEGGEVEGKVVEGGETPPLRRKPTLGQIVAYFKYQTTKSINQIRDLPGVKLWQRNYYEHIIRTEECLEKLREYIMQNPQRWDIDQLHPNNPSKW